MPSQSATAQEVNVKTTWPNVNFSCVHHNLRFMPQLHFSNDTRFFVRDKEVFCDVFLWSVNAFFMAWISMQKHFKVPPKWTHQCFIILFCKSTCHKIPVDIKKHFHFLSPWKCILKTLLLGKCSFSRQVLRPQHIGHVIPSSLVESVCTLVPYNAIVHFIQHYENSFLLKRWWKHCDTINILSYITALWQEQTIWPLIIHSVKGPPFDDKAIM